MRTTTTGLVAAATLALALTACGTTPKPDRPAGKPESGPSAAETTLSPEARESIRAANGIPPEPSPEDRGAFLAFLDTIDPDIVHGKEDKAVSRGKDTCSTYRRYPGDTAKQIDITNKRWTSPTHPEGHGLATAAKILEASHMHLCPDF
ncbi:DUF732 domain-containing protein [Streptomyces sp. NPDC004520]|uniref:DUF732 domain-containing protein n=1 Tax=Streptomyces sp. NPDC004520 TaxID=3364702 RepID=UPI0036D03FEC